MLWWIAAATLLCLVLYKVLVILGHIITVWLLSHPSLCTSCMLDHLLCGVSLLCGTWCPVLDLVLLLWVHLFLSSVLCFLASICRHSPLLWAQILAVGTVHVNACWSILLFFLFPILPFYFCILWLLEVSRQLLSEDLFPLLWWCNPANWNLTVAATFLNPLPPFPRRCNLWMSALGWVLHTCSLSSIWFCLDQLCPTRGPVEGFMRPSLGFGCSKSIP